MTSPYAPKLTLRANPVFDLYLAMKRQVTGSKYWEPALLPHGRFDEPVRLFAAGVAALARSDLRQVDTQVAQVSSVAEIRGIAGMTAGPGGETGQSGPGALDMIADSLERAGHQLEQAIKAYCPPVEDALEASPAELTPRLEACLGLMGQILRIDASARELDVLLVPFSPFRLPCDVLTGPQPPAMCYADYRQFRGSDLAQAVLAVAVWALEADRAPGGADAPAAGEPSLWDQIAAAVTQSDPQRQALSRILMIVLINLTAAHAVRTHLDPAHVDNAERLGIYQRYRRLTDAVAPVWRRYLDGTCPPDQVVRATARTLREMPADCYIRGQAVDPMVADFYLLELMSSENDRIARVLLERLEQALAADFVRYLHIAIGAELSHFQIAPGDTLSDELRNFIADVNYGDSRLCWHKLYAATGIPALILAERALYEAGAKFGGRAWAPITALLRHYVTGDINRRVFIDQCFSIKHNNGPIFDKLYDVSAVDSALAAQAAGDLARLSAFASPEVRHLYRRRLVLRRAQHDPAWLGVQQDTASDVTGWEIRYGWSSPAQNPRDWPNFHESGSRS